MIDGVLMIDKPSGMTSHDVVQRIRRLAKQRRVGHLGTLDPLATGVLPIALGEGTKLSQLLTHGTKAYRGSIRLGLETTTYDLEGEVVARTGPPWPARAELEQQLEGFRGEISQVPPPYSAIKQGGEAAYRRARRGESVELPARPVTIYRLSLERYAPPFVEIDVECSAGTYLRSLAHDLGHELGTGGCLWELTRTASGPFTGQGAIALAEIEAAGTIEPSRVIPMCAATGLPTCEVPVETARRVSHGVRLLRRELRGVPHEGLLQLVAKGRMVALMEAEKGIPELRTVRVFLEGTAG